MSEEVFRRKCKACGQEIEFRRVYTREGWKRHPFNVGTNTSHFQTCPFAKQFLPDKPKIPKAVVRVKGPLDFYLEEDENEF
jgi:hypothetical protein